MEPIATYSEQRFDGKRTFNLFADAVVVTGCTTFSSDFQARIPLASLDPHHSTLRIRHQTFSSSLWVALISFGAREVLVGPLQMPWSATLPGLALVIGMVGLVMCLATFRKVEFVRFTTQAGVAVLDLARAGPERARFDPFVDALVKQIRAASGAA